ncbi:MAG TPA: hypothetical protein VFI17_12375 [Solirubrobacterales bacterium]|nr:hypothetical protein [Solirubrobacterales bacterium]
MKKLKGPDLKMPELKVPAVVEDLYRDLRDRRLLPLLGLVLVAIAAVPFLLSSRSEPKPVPTHPPAITGTNASQLTVVRANPGLRDYRKRLRGRTPTDPFRKRSSGTDLAGTKLGSKGDNGFEGTSTSTSTTTTTSSTGTSTVTKETTKSAGGESTTTTTETDKSGSGSTPGDESAGGGPSGEQINLYSFAIDLKITKTADKPDGSKETAEPQVRHEVLPPAPLPGAKAQVVTYMGISPKTHNPLLLVSDAVTAVFGEAKCLSGETKCQLLEVETGIPTTFVFGPNDVRYKINILKVKTVSAGHL